MKKIPLYIAFLLLQTSFAQQPVQELFPSEAKIETLAGNYNFIGETDAAIVQYNENTSEIAIRIDISKINTDYARVDSVFDAMGKQYMYLKGVLPYKNLNYTDINNSDEREYHGSAFLGMNGITRQVPFTAVVYNLSNNDEFSVGNIAYPIRMNIYFEFEPEDFALNKIYAPLVNPIKINVARAFVNKLTLDGPTIFTK